MVIVQLTDQNFEAEVLRSDLPVLVDFWAEWCSPCRVMEPIIEGLKGEKGIKGKIKIGKINVDENPQTASKYNIMGIPILVFFKDGKEVKRLVGVRGKEEIIKFLITNF